MQRTGIQASDQPGQKALTEDFIEIKIEVPVADSYPDAWTKVSSSDHRILVDNEAVEHVRLVL
jgi:hypothetical protein